MSEREQFNAAYWGSKKPEVQALSGMEPFSPERMDAAIQLAMDGHVIDAEIDARGASPWETMKLREAYGYTWVPSLLQDPVKIAPGLVVPGQPMYDDKAFPAGSLRVSSSVSAYPPYSPLSQESGPLVPQGVPWLAMGFGGGRVAVLPGDMSPDGTLYTAADGRVWVKRVRLSPFGAWAWWEVKL